MLDVYDRYQKGLIDLLKIVPQSDPGYLVLLTLQARLMEVIYERRQLGPTDNIQAGIARIVQR